MILHGGHDGDGVLPESMDMLDQFVIYEHFDIAR